MSFGEALGANQTAGITIITFIVAVAISLGYYQFMFVPQANEKLSFSYEVTHPAKTFHVVMVKGAASQTSLKHFVAKEVTVALGLSNRVNWKNNDEIAHTVASDNLYKDRYSGVFDSLAHQN